MTEKIAKPEIRFAGFNDTWEQRKLSEINTYFTDGNYGEAYPKASDMTDHLNGVPFLTGGNLKKGKLDLNGASYITKDKHEKLTSGHLVEDDIVIAVRGSLGALGYVNKENSGWNINSQLAILRTDKSILRGRFLIQYLLSEKAQIDLLSRTTGSALKQLPIGQLRDFEVPITKIGEQEAIGAYFQNLDNLITLHQRKYDKLTNVKKSMLDKMFPKNGAKVPEIRFKGFTDDWEQCKVKDVFDFLQNNSLSRAELTTYGEIMNVHYGDILIKYGEILDIKKENLTYVIDNSIIKKYQTSLLKNGDVLIADAAEDETVGKCSEITGVLNDIVLSGLHTIPCRPKIKFAKGYLGYYMNSRAYHDQLLPLIQGTKISSISKSIIQYTVITYPKSTDEQEKISTIFENLNNNINYHKQKLEKLKNIKKSLLERMFV